MTNATTNLDKYAALGAKAVAEGKDMTKDKGGKGGKPPICYVCGRPGYLAAQCTSEN